MKKLFREHRGGLEESLATTIECPNGLTDIKKHFNNQPYANISMDLSMRDNRLPEEWGDRQYVVIADTRDINSKVKPVVLGFCNFWEDIPKISWPNAQPIIDSFEEHFEEMSTSLSNGKLSQIIFKEKAE